MGRYPYTDTTSCPFPYGPLGHPSQSLHLSSPFHSLSTSPFFLSYSLLLPLQSECHNPSSTPFFSLNQPARTTAPHFFVPPIATISSNAPLTAATPSPHYSLAFKLVSRHLPSFPLPLLIAAAAVQIGGLDAVDGFGIRRSFGLKEFEKGAVDGAVIVCSCIHHCCQERK